jgi:hypothetical protein
MHLEQIDAHNTVVSTLKMTKSYSDSWRLLLTNAAMDVLMEKFPDAKGHEMRQLGEDIAERFLTKFTR